LARVAVHHDHRAPFRPRCGRARPRPARSRRGDSRPDARRLLRGRDRSGRPRAAPREPSRAAARDDRCESAPGSRYARRAARLQLPREVAVTAAVRRTRSERAPDGYDVTVTAVLAFDALALLAIVGWCVFDMRHALRISSRDAREPVANLDQPRPRSARDW